MAGSLGFRVGGAAQLPEGLPESVQISPSLHREYTDTDIQEKLHPISASGLADLSWPRLQPGRCSVLLRRYKHRWKVERLFAWLQNYRRLITRHERHMENFLGFVRLGCISILLRHF